MSHNQIALKQPRFPISHLGQVRHVDISIVPQKRAQVELVEDVFQLPWPAVESREYFCLQSITYLSLCPLFFVFF